MRIWTFFGFFLFGVLRLLWVPLDYTTSDLSNDASYMGFQRIFGAISFKKIFVENPNLMFEYLDKDKSGSAEIFTTDSLNDKEQNVRIGFSLGTLSFFFVNCTKNLLFTQLLLRIVKVKKDPMLRYNLYVCIWCRLKGIKDKSKEEAKYFENLKIFHASPLVMVFYHFVSDLNISSFVNWKYLKCWF